MRRVEVVRVVARKAARRHVWIVGQSETLCGQPVPATKPAPEAEPADCSRCLEQVRLAEIAVRA